MSRFKVNAGQTPIYRSPLGQPSDLYRRFKRQFSILLNPDPTNRNFLEKVYVKNLAYHEELADFCSYQEDSYRCIIGLTGIGKTTLLRNFFELNTFTRTDPMKNIEIVIRDGELIVFMNPESTASQGSAESQAGYLFGAAAEKVRKEYCLSCIDEELYDFIEQNKPTLIEKARTKRIETQSEILENMFSTNRRGLSLETLKFFLSKQECQINRVIIILDNIEALQSWDVKKRYISEALIDYECFKNAELKYFVKLIISCRPDSYYRLMREDTFNNYPHRNELLMTVPASIDDIFRERFDALIVRDGIKVKNKEEWNRAQGILTELAKELCLRSQNLILELWNYNVRESVNHFERILANRQWFQNGFPLKSAFRIEKRFFSQKQSNIKKALLYGNGTKYVEHTDNPVVNILKNSDDSDYDLVSLYILAFFKNQAAHDDDFNYFQYVEISDLIDSCNGMFLPADIKTAFQEGIEHLIKAGCLFISPWDSGERTKLARTPRADALLWMLQESSLLLEALRDDLWIDENDFQAEYSQNLCEKDLFIELFNLVSKYIDKELSCVQAVRDSGQCKHYIKMFGASPITKQLYNGLHNSTYAYYNKFIENAAGTITDLRAKFDEITTILEGDAT